MQRWTLWIVIAVAGAPLGCADPARSGVATLLEQARGSYERQQYASAVTRLDQLLGQNPKEPETTAALYLRGISQARLGRRAAAYADLRNAVSRGGDPDAVWRSYVVLGTLAFEDESWSDAGQYLRAAATRMPNATPKDTVLARLAMCHERTGRWSEVRPVCQQIVTSFGAGPHAEWARRRTQLGATHFAVQCGAFTQRKNAEALQTNLARRGFDAYIRSEPRARGSLDVVLVGRYASYAEAQRQLQLIRSTAADLARDAVLWP